MQAILVMFRPDGEKRSFSVVREVTVIGRREDCDLRIPLTEVSRKHCRVLKDGEELRVEDLGSSNGTFRNGQRVRESQLNAGDTLAIGSVLFAVQIDGQPADSELSVHRGNAPAAGSLAAADESANTGLVNLAAGADALQADEDPIILADDDVPPPPDDDVLIDMDSQDAR